MVTNNYYNEINDRVGGYDQQIKQLEPYKLLNELLLSGKWYELPNNFLQNSDFIKEKAAEYHNIFKQRAVDQDILKNYNTKYTSWDSLNSVVWKISNELSSTENDLLQKISGLWNIFWWEKSDLIDRINKNADVLKSSVSGQSQEEQSLAEWLWTRRGVWTKAMEDLTRTSLQNKEIWQKAEIENNTLTQLQNVSNLYNQLLNNLLIQYKSTKDTYVLWKIQNTVNILEALWKYWKTKSPDTGGEQESPDTKKKIKKTTGGDSGFIDSNKDWIPDTLQPSLNKNIAMAEIQKKLWF